MRIVLLGLVGGLLLLLVGAAFVGVDPKDRRPGLWLSGEVAEEIPSDWSFTNDHREVWLETRPWYGIPHSVTTVIAVDEGVLYVPSIYAEPGPFPGTKYWNRIVDSDPRVRLKIGNTLYPMTIRPARDDVEFRRGLEALARKYEFWETALNDLSKRPPMAILKLEPRS